MMSSRSKSSAIAETATASRLASPWHTGALVALIVTVAVVGTILTHATAAAPSSPMTHGSRMENYGAILIVQWALVFYVGFVGREPGTPRLVLGDDWARTWQRLVGDVGAALAVIAVVEGVALSFTRAVGMSHRTGPAAILPATTTEHVAWVAVAVSVGISEEIVYRGYLQRQLGTLFHRDMAGIVLQALLFAVAHADQQIRSVEIGAYGLFFGLVVRWRRSLFPVILAHVAIDLLSGGLA